MESYSIESDKAFYGDLSANLVGFCRLLRRHGVAIGIQEQADALRALGTIPLEQPESFYWALKITLAKTPQEQEIFHHYFSDFWSVWHESALHRKQEDLHPHSKKRKPTHPKPKPSNFITIRDWLNKKDPYEEEKEAAGYSPMESFSQKDFSEFDGDELKAIQQWIQQISRILANRMSRRYKIAAKGRLDLRSCIRKNLRNGDEILELVQKQKRLKKLKLVLLCDVSQSMELYSRFVIQFLYAFQTVFRKIDIFVFSTILHPISPLLRFDNLDEVLDELSENLEGWGGGTRIGQCFHQYLSAYADTTLTPNTLVFIMSDGWDTGDLTMLQHAMEQLKTQSKYIIWLNPLKGYADYQPSCQGMQIALPYIDYFGAAHNLQSLQELATQLSKWRTGGF